MTKKFNPKVYLGKPRLYVAVPNETRISRLWIWDDEAKEYCPPVNGKQYLTNRYEPSGGSSKRVVRYFETIEVAREWQRGVATAPLVVAQASEKKSGPLFGDVVKEWKRRCFDSIKPSTQISYEKLIRLYFGDLLDCTIYEITPQKIDEWLDVLKDPKNWTMESKKRTTFKNELKLLVTILNYYGNYHDDDPNFRFPAKLRHRKSIQLNRRKMRSQDLKEEEFLLFRKTLSNLYLRKELKARGELMAALATVQFYQAYRASEAAALHWEDIYFDWKNPSNSRIRVSRFIFWPRVKEVPSQVLDGYKNADANEGVKDQPMFPETFEILHKLHYEGARGLIFSIDGKHLEYRTIQSAYDRAFKKVGFLYRGTHVMRHGGCRRVYNQEGDLAVAQQLLGNSDLKSTLVYAKRSATALTEVAQRYWEQKNEKALVSDRK